MNTRNNNPIIQRGNYLLRSTRSGGYAILRNTKPRNRINWDSASYMPPKEEIVKRFKDPKKKLSETDRTYLCHLAVLEFGISSVQLGREIVGLRTPQITTKRGKVDYKVTQEEVQRSLEQTYPHELIERAFNGEADLIGIEEFRKRNERVVHACHRSGKLKGHAKNGLRHQMQLYHDGLYDFLRQCVIPEGIDRIALREKLTSRFYSGQTLKRRHLLTSPDDGERRLGREILHLVKEMKGKRARSTIFEEEIIRDPKKFSYFEEVISKLTDLKREDLTMISAARHECALIAERLTNFFFTWAYLSEYHSGNPKLRAIDWGEVNSGYKYNTFKLVSREKGRSDLRMNNTAIEIKTGTADFPNKQIREAIRRYSPGKNTWLDRQPLDKTVMIFHQERKFYDKAIDELKNAGIVVITAEEFNKELVKLISLLKPRYGEMLTSLEPRIHDLDYLAVLQRKISSAQQLEVLIRKGNKDLRTWSINVLEQIIKEGEHMFTSEEERN